MKDLQELIQEREQLSFMMVEAEGDLYCELIQKLEELETEIYIAKEDRKEKPDG